MLLTIRKVTFHSRHNLNKVQDYMMTTAIIWDSFPGDNYNEYFSIKIK